MSNYQINNKNINIFSVQYSFQKCSSCFVDPQHQGVKIWEVRNGIRKELVVDGRQTIKSNTNPHHMTNSPVRHRQNIFEFKSRNGVVELQLEVTRDYDIPAPKAFKFNYTLAL